MCERSHERAFGPTHIYEYYALMQRANDDIVFQELCATDVIYTSRASLAQQLWMVFERETNIYFVLIEVKRKRMMYLYMILKNS